MSERRRLKAGVEVEVFPSGWGYVDKRWDWGMSPSQVHYLTEPIPENEEERTAPEPPLDVRVDCVEEHCGDLERRIEALEERHQALVDRVVALEPPRRATLKAEQDAPGGDEPSVEEVLEWLEDIAGGWVATPGAKQPGAAARIIREQREEIEYLEGMSRDRWHEIREQRAKIDRLTEELGPAPSRKVATKEDVERVAKAIEGGVTYLRMARRALIAMGYEIEEGT